MEENKYLTIILLLILSCGCAPNKEGSYSKLNGFVKDYKQIYGRNGYL